MKNTVTKLLCGSALGLALLATSPVLALPPRQHVVRGIIQSIDYDSRILTVSPSGGAKSLVFVWKDSTRFTQGGKKICLGALETGLVVNVHYRREIGQLVPREVSVRREAQTRCTSGQCCAPRR